MLKFNSDLQTILSGATSKLDWCNKLVTALGSGLKVRAWRSPDVNSTTVSSTGTEFFNAAIVGAPVTNAGAIVKFGKLISATIQQAADLSTGASVLRIEGASNWIEGTLGLTTSSCDFKVTSSPGAGSGFAFSTISISGPKSLPSGTGPLAPTLDADAPAWLELEDWTNPNNVKLVDRIPLDTRIEDYVFQDTEMAAEIGDVRVTQSSKTIVFGSFEFGVSMLSIHGGLNLDNPGKPVHQVLVAHKPYNTWPTYPLADTFRASRDITHPNPYKLKIRKADNTVLKTIEMRDGLPVNSPQLSQIWGLFPEQIVKSDQALRPHMNCAQLHFWQSDRLKYNSNMLKYYPGVVAQDLRPSMAKNGVSSNACVAIAIGDQVNSALNWYALPQWPLPDSPSGTMTYPPVDNLDTYEDPYLFDAASYAPYYGGHAHRISGWDYEPGAIMGHDWFTGPGGVRHDRAALPTPLVKYVSEPNGSRLKGNVPHRTMLDRYNHGYFHHSHHYFTDVKNFTILPKEYFRDGAVTFMNAYYGQGPFTPINRTVDLRCSSGGGSWPAKPRDGHTSIWNRWTCDTNHSNQTAYVATMFCNSVAHAISGATRLHVHVMGQLGSAPPTVGTAAEFMQRIHAWKTMQLVYAWKCASAHPMAIDRETIEQRLQAELESVYDKVYKPAMLDNDQSLYSVGIRRFGMPMSVQYPYVTNPWKNQKWIGSATDSKASYFTIVLAVMRQTGCWAAMVRRSTKVAAVLPFLLSCLDKQAIEMFYYTQGRWENEFCNSPRVPSSFDANGVDTAPDPVMFNSWADYDSAYPRVGQTSLMTDSNGNATNAYFGATVGLHIQWCYMRRDFFPEYPHPLLADVITMIDKWHNDLETKINGISAPRSKVGSDLTYLWPPHGRMKAPSTLAPL